MSNSWVEVARSIEPLEGIELDSALVADFERGDAASAVASREMRFHVPSFKAYATSELQSCGKSAWPAVSVTGGECSLACDHCQAKILEPMLPARTPEALWRIANEQIERGAQGMLVSGGSNHRNEVEYDRYYPVIRRIKDTFPAFGIALHTALVDRAIAQRTEAAGVDVAMMDVIGAQDTISQVYHLKRSVADFERSLECLVATAMKTVPHIVLGLHYGRLLGEWNALEIVARHRPDALVLVVVMPLYAPRHRPFVTPDAVEVGRFFVAARRALPATPLMLGCARPAGSVKAQFDAYAVMAGLDGIAHPADGMVELAVRLGRKVSVSPSCCSVAAGEAVLAAPFAGGIDPQLVIERERGRPRARGGLAGIPVVAG